ncbi:cation:proton antiporter [Cellulomonas soli]|uniref:cation:proton antiporter n=1 Tax=Cellulomonas soli TaxID=931535 RepID=UPI003F848650
MTTTYTALLPVFAVALLSPLVVGALPRRWKVPQVVLLLAGGVLIGPQGLGWSDPAAVQTLSDLGIGFLFLLAGYELDPRLMRQRAGRLALGAWGTSLVFAVVLVALVLRPASPQALAAGAIALATTALGVLLPILRDSGQLGTRLGTTVFAAGAVGELAPIVVMALLLGSRRSSVAAALLFAFAALVVALAAVPTRITLPRVSALLLRVEHGTGQSTLRLTVVLLVGLLATSAALGFDAILGAFLGGMVLRRWAPGDVEQLEGKLDVVGWGVFIPVFFIGSGMGLDAASILRTPWLPPVFLVLLLVVRGGPALFWLRRDLGARERVQVALYSATTLPLLVALTELSVDEGLMPRDTAAALVGAGVLSIIVFPLVAQRLSAEPSAVEGLVAKR